MRSMSVSYYTSFFFSCYGAHRLLHSFPTRRSSDLPTLLYGMILGLAIPLLALQVVTAVEPGSRRSEEHRLNSSHSSISYAVFCLKKKLRTHEEVELCVLADLLDPLGGLLRQ